MIFAGNDSGPVLRTERHKSYMLKGLQHLSESYEVTRCCHDDCWYSRPVTTATFCSYRCSKYWLHSINFSSTVTILLRIW